MVRECRTRMILGIPLWRSSPWYSMLERRGDWVPFVKDSLCYGKGANILTPGTYQLGPFGEARVASDFAFCLCEF